MTLINVHPIQAQLMAELGAIQGSVEAGEEEVKEASRVALDRHIRVLWELSQNDYVKAGLHPSGEPREEVRFAQSIPGTQRDRWHWAGGECVEYPVLCHARTHRRHHNRFDFY